MKRKSVKECIKRLRDAGFTAIWANFAEGGGYIETSATEEEVVELFDGIEIPSVRCEQ